MQMNLPLVLVLYVEVFSKLLSPCCLLSFEPGINPMDSSRNVFSREKKKPHVNYSRARIWIPEDFRGK